jgi:hypothetical protein
MLCASTYCCFQQGEIVGVHTSMTLRCTDLITMPLVDPQLWGSAGPVGRQAQQYHNRSSEKLVLYQSSENVS